jgi:hypothetical protein
MTCLPSKDWLRRAAVWLLGVGPACAVLAYAVWIRTPIHRSLLEEEFTKQIGRPVRIGAVFYPRPGVTRVQELVVSGPGPISSAVHIGQVVWRRGGTGQPAEVSLEAVVLRSVDRATLLSFAQLLEGLPAGSRAGDCPLVRGQIGRITIEDPAGRLEFSGGRCERQLTAETLTVSIALVPEAGRAGSPVEIRWIRGRTACAAVGYGFHTGDNFLPLAVLGRCFPGFSHLDRQGSFAGYVWQVEEATSTRGELAGTVRLERLEEVLTGIWAGSIRGRAELGLQKLVWQEGRWLEGAGFFRAGDGHISADFLRKWLEHIPLQVAGRYPATSGWIPFAGLAFRFRLDASGIYLFGGTQDGEPGGIQQLDNAPILHGPGWALLAPANGLYIPWERAMVAFVPPGESLVPPTPAAATLLAVLPVPPQAAERIASKEAPSRN